MSYFQVEPRLKLYYLDENQEGFPTVLLLHGLGANGSSWLLQFPALLEAGFCILAPDTPGFGQSTYPGGGTSVAKLTAAIARLLESRQDTPMHVVGISLGGTQALQLALDYPQYVRKLILVNTFAKLDFLSNTLAWPYFAWRFILVHTLGIPTQARYVANKLFPHPNQNFLRQALYEQIIQSDPQAYRAALRAIVQFDITSRLCEIYCPTLVVTGQDDTTVPPEAQCALANGINGARQVILPDAGHGIIVEQPEKFNHAMLEFLKGTAG